MYFVKTPKLVQQFFPNYVWKIPTEEKKIYLTFDDGPIPEVTPWVLETLAAHNAKGTFFCVGDNVRKHPAVYQQILEADHAVGNHTFNHLRGLKTSTENYVQNTTDCAALVTSNLFRPPHGRLKFSQSKRIRTSYHIVLWDVLSGDFDLKLSKEQCLKNVLNNVETGSIVVFHDSLKAQDKLRFVLPKVLKYFSERAYVFEKVALGK